MSSFGGSELVPKFFFSMAVSGAGVSRTSRSILYIFPLVNENALAESIITQLIHTLEWLRRLHQSSDRNSREFASSLALACGCYDECNNARMQYTTSQLMHG